MSCQCCKNPFGVCHNNYRCDCHPQERRPPRIEPEPITTNQVRAIMRVNR